MPSRALEQHDLIKSANKIAGIDNIKTTICSLGYDTI